jgi:hypothetical protein
MALHCGWVPEYILKNTSASIGLASDTFFKPGATFSYCTMPQCISYTKHVETAMLYIKTTK